MSSSVDENFLVVDVQGVQNPYHPERGIARYVRELSGALLQHGSDSIECFVANPKLGLVDGLEPLIASGSLAWNHPEGPVDRNLHSKPMVFWATSVFEIGTSVDDVWPMYVRRPDVFTAITVYDLIPLIYPDHYLRDPAFRLRYRARLGLIQSADLILTISEATAEDVIRMLDVPRERVVNIGTGVSDLWRPPGAGEDPIGEIGMVFPEVRPGYVFYTGGIDFRKNMERLLEAYAMLRRSLRKKHQLVITCSMDPIGELALRQLIQELEIEDDVVLTGFVSDETLLNLYQAAHLFVFPSLYEGFGLPLVEAMRAGVPALAADRASMREIVPQPDFRFDPMDLEAMAFAMTRAVTDDDFRRSALEEEQRALQRFTWDNVATRALEACADLWSSRSLGLEPSETTGFTTSVRARPRVAWFSPMPPQPSGIADYSARLVHELARYVDIDVFVDGLVRDYEPPGSNGVTLRPVRSFRLLDAAGAYDEVVYCMGNSEFHASAYEALLERPGVVLAHEVRFSGFYSWYSANRSTGATLFRRSLAAQHPKVPENLGARGWITVDEAERFGIYMVSELVERSTQFLVHSRYAADVAALNAEPQFERISIVPFGIQKPASSVSFDSKSVPLVITIGIAAEVKRTEAFVRSIPTVLESVPEARFAIVGGFAPPEFEEVIEELALALGIAERLTITGHVGMSEYDSWLRRATCAVQLRATSNGETSAAVADCLRNGLPTIVTGIGPAREYPVGSVYSVPAQASARQIGEAIVRVASDADLGRSLSTRGLEFARTSTFEAAALSLLDVLGLRSPDSASVR